jgi:glycosyltransferase involved in cell wall biosynthesis
LAQEMRASLGWAPDDQVILFIAQHNWVKGPDIAIEVFRRAAKVNPKARFLVVGSGRMTDWMKTTAQQRLRPEVIHFAGFVPSMQTVPYYLASDLVLCTSRYETWARMVNEAMLCRRPCVVSRVVPAAGGLIVHGQNGYVVAEPEAGLVTDAIAAHFALPMAERRNMGNAAREQAQRFAYEPAMDNVVEAARYALERRRPARAAT